MINSTLVRRVLLLLIIISVYRFTVTGEENKGNETMRATQSRTMDGN